MPEGPEVRIIAEELHALLNGKTLKDITLNSGPYLTSKREEYVTLREDLRKLHLILSKRDVRVNFVRCKGKYIYMQLGLYQDGQCVGVRYLGNHLGMTGHWRTDKGLHSHITISYTDPSTPEKIQEIYFDDARRFGNFFVLTQAELKDKLSTLGVDVLGPNFTKEALKSALNKSPNKALGVILLDQEIICGVGNYLRADTLYVARLNPRRTPSSLTENEWEALYQAIYSVTRKSYEAHGTTIQTYRDVYMKPGYYDPLVYGKKKDPEGHPVRVVTIGGRTMHWVPAVQK
jgi:DNA-formamidopyrimidine glycosylase